MYCDAEMILKILGERGKRKWVALLSWRNKFDRALVMSLYAKMPLIAVLPWNIMARRYEKTMKDAQADRNWVLDASYLRDKKKHRIGGSGQFLLY